LVIERRIKMISSFIGILGLIIVGIACPPIGILLLCIWAFNGSIGKLVK